MSIYARNSFFLAAGLTALVAATASAMPGFGQLSYNGNPVAFTPGSGIGNDGFTFSETNSGLGTLMIGLKAHDYYGDSMPANASTTSGLSGGGSWLNVDGQGRYTGLAGTGTYHSAWNPIPFRWQFDWSITLDGQRVDLGVLNTVMTITRPDLTTFTSSLTDVGDVFNNDAGETVYQNSWNMAYAGGVDANNTRFTEGEWKIQFTVFGANGEGELGSQEIIVTTPAPGALALLGLAGAVGGRRRRS